MNRMILFALSLIVFGCVKRLPIPDAQPSHIVDPHAAWARVLNENVDDEGRVNFDGIRQDTEDLDTWVAYVAKVSPETRPDLYQSKEERLAYYIDAYNGLAMYAALNSGLRPEQKVRFFFMQKLTLGGKALSLYKIETNLIRDAFKEARVHFALNCMSVGCPRLPRETWDGDSLEDQLQDAATEFFNSEKHCRVDAEAKKVHLSEILDFYTDDFLRDSSSLIAYVNKFREEKIPTNFEVVFIPYDWTLNAQPKVEASAAVSE